MNRDQRRAHALVWPILAATLLATVVAALAAKARIDIASPPAATDARDR